MRRFFLLTAVVALIAAFAFSNQASQADNSPTQLVQVSASEVDKLEGISAQFQQDYGSFQWLAVNETELAQLDEAGVAYTIGSSKIHVPNYTFDPLLDGEPALPSRLMQPENAEEGFFLVQFNGPTVDAWLAQLEAEGLHILQYYPQYSFLVWGKAEAVNRVADTEMVRWSGAFHPAYKLDGSVLGREGRINNVDLLVYNDANFPATVKAIEEQGGTIIQTFPAQPDKALMTIIAELDASNLESIAQENNVLWMGYLSPTPVLDDEMAAQIMAGNHPGGTPFVGYADFLANELGYDGTGVRWAVIDTGADYAHPDLNIVDGYSFPGTCDLVNLGNDCANGGHGTHVAGIIAGTGTSGYADGDGFLYGMGVAPGSEIFAMNSLSDSPWPPVGGWQEHSKQAVLGNAIGGNNSWTTGEGTQHGYQNSERTHDIMVLDGNFDTTTVAEPFIEVFSAGNSGSAGLTAPKEGKNLIVVASSRNARAGSIDDISGFSSRGPAVDGRWVPTISAPGEQIASTKRIAGASQCGTSISGTDDHHSFCSGTSMAAPQVSGAIVLATEWWRTFNGGADPSAAMAKALLVNGAVDMGTPDIPNINEGWGRVNVTNIISPNVDTLYWDQTDVFGNTGESIQINVGIADPSKPLKVTIAWLDAPGAPGANPSLVNNLDLTVETNGQTYLGNVFSNGLSVTGGSADAINNLENVFVQMPGGSAKITIDAVNISGDAILYNADTTDQSFALVCYNCTLQPGFTLGVSPSDLDVCSPTDPVYDITIGSILSYTTPVDLTAIVPAGTTAQFGSSTVTPEGSTTLTVTNASSLPSGGYSVSVVGTSLTRTLTQTVGFVYNTVAPTAPTLVTPADDATNIDVQPTLTWDAIANVSSYDIEIATDANFNNIVESATTVATSYAVSTLLSTGTTYYWRVRANNGCGVGSYSTPFSFTTEFAPGDCSPDRQATNLYSQDFEDGAASDWTHGGNGDTWQLTMSNSNSGDYSYFAENVGQVSDQYLFSPAIELPAGESPLTLQFWNRQEMEDGGAGCYDGGVLEISTDGGSSWTRINSEDLLTDPYDGTVDSGYSNPLAGEEAWCGDPQEWLNSIVDIDAYAGQTVNFRFRIATDTSVSHPGWWIDDVKVQSCAVPSEATISGDSSLIVEQGETAVHTFTITNTGSFTESFGVAVEGGDWATNVSTNSTGELLPGESAVVNVTVDAPQFRLMPSSSITMTDRFTLTVTPTEAPQNVSYAYGDTHVPLTVDLTLSPNDSDGGQPGSIVTYMVDVTNSGEYTDTYTISLHDHSWVVTSSHTTVGPIAPMSTETIMISVEVGPEASVSDTVRVRVTSTLDANVYNEVLLQTLVITDYPVYLPIIMNQP